MLITIKSFNGFTLNNTDYLSAAIRAKSPPDAKLVFVDQSKADAIYSGAFNINVRSVPVGVKLIDQANHYALEAQLKEALRPGTEGVLLATFGDDTRDYSLDCVVQSITADEKYENFYTVIFQTGESAWKTVTPVTDSWAVTASGDTKAITVGGYSPTRLSLTLTATQLPATGWAYQKLYQLVNIPAYSYGLRPWCIAIDTAAMVTAGKCQADCDDILVIVDGKITPRWIADPNTDHTHVWFNVDLIAGQTLTLLTAIAATGAITTMDFAKTKNTETALNALPARGFIQHGTEWFEFTGKKNYSLTISTRAALGTTMQAHSAADVFNWIQHSIYILYGNSGATNPSTNDATYDDTKPLFDLSASSNTTWVYTASTKFLDLLKPGRTGAWTPMITKIGNVSELYQVKENAESGDPAMGMRISTWVKTGKPQTEKATLCWQMSHAGGINNVSMTGRKYRSSTLWPATAAIQLQRSSNGKTWTMQYSVATPTVVSTWEAITKSSEALTTAMAYVRFLFDGSLSAQLDTDTYFEVLTATVVFVSANEPTGTLLTEKSNYLLNISIENTENEDIVKLVFPMLLNTALLLDGESYGITYGLVNAHSALSLDDDSRDIWIRLDPGSNTLEITGDDVATITVALSWLERRL